MSEKVISGILSRVIVIVMVFGLLLLASVEVISVGEVCLSVILLLVLVEISDANDNLKEIALANYKGDKG